MMFTRYRDILILSCDKAGEVMKGINKTSFLITGATGYIGSNLIKYLCDHTDSKIYALVRDKDKATKQLQSGISILESDLTSWNAYMGQEQSLDYIIHCASITKSLEMISHPVKVIESIVNTTQDVMELARKCRCKSVVYLSSMEVYGDIDCSNGHRVSEKELGSIDLFNVRSCYPMGKRMAENICYSYFKEYGVPVKIVRLAQTFGRGVLPTDTRVFAQFVRAAKEKNNIVLHTQGNSMGNYCGIDDTVSGIMTVLHYGKDGESYNVVNEANTMTVGQMAELVANRVAGGKIKVTYEIPQDNIYGYAVDTGLRLSGEKLMGLGWKPMQSIEDMYRDMLEEL